MSVISTLELSPVHEVWVDSKLSLVRLDESTMAPLPGMDDILGAAEEKNVRTRYYKSYKTADKKLTSENFILQL